MGGFKVALTRRLITLIIVSDQSRSSNSKCVPHVYVGSHVRLLVLSWLQRVFLVRSMVILYIFSASVAQG
jgi:hypothetical protein